MGSARFGELCDTEFGLQGVPQGRQVTVAFDPAQTRFDVQQPRGYPAVTLR